jgi:hypothetical protein
VSRGTRSSWKGMRERCNNPKAANYARYGGRGIRVLWETFEEFAADMGERPIGMSIDRVNVDGHYCRENCRWSDARTQRANQRPKPKRVIAAPAPPLRQPRRTSWTPYAEDGDR